LKLTWFEVVQTDWSKVDSTLLGPWWTDLTWSKWIETNSTRGRLDLTHSR